MELLKIFSRYKCRCAILPLYLLASTLGWLCWEPREGKIHLRTKLSPVSAKEKGVNVKHAFHCYSIFYYLGSWLSVILCQKSFSTCFLCFCKSNILSTSPWSSFLFTQNLQKKCRDFMSSTYFSMKITSSKIRENWFQARNLAFLHCVGVYWFLHALAWLGSLLVLLI